MLENKKLILLTFSIALLSMFSAIFVPEIINVPYAFYNIIKLLTFSSLAYISYYLFLKKMIVLSFIILIFVILYNPLTPIYLTRTFWIIIDVLIISILVISSIKIIKYLSLNKDEEQNNKIEKCNILEELNKLKKYEKKIFSENITFDDSIDLLKLIGISLGHFNENLLKKLFLINKLKFENLTIANSLKQLSSYYNKNTINDLYYINQVRNKIVHSGDHIEFNKDTKEYFLQEIKSAIVKANFQYHNLIKQ